MRSHVTKTNLIKIAFLLSIVNTKDNKHVNVKLFLFSNMLYITLGFLFDQGIYINVKHEAMFTFVKSLIDK